MIKDKDEEVEATTQRAASEGSDNVSQSSGSEHEDKDEEVKKKTQRAASEGSDKTRAAEGKNHVSSNDQIKFDCFYDFVKFAFSFDALQSSVSELQDKDEEVEATTQRAAFEELLQGSFLGLGYSYDFDVQQQLRGLFDGNFLTVSQSGLDANNHFVSLLLNPESKRNKDNFERFVSRVTELKRPISFIAVDFATGDVKHLCDFLDKAILKLIEMGSVQKNVKIFLPLSCEGKLKFLTTKHFEVKLTVDDHVIKDVLFKHNTNLKIETEFLYVDYSINKSKLETITTKKRASSRQGIYIPYRNGISTLNFLNNCFCFFNSKREECCG